MAEVDSPEDLPQGWCLKGRKVKYYMNSRTGQKFFSKDDLMRHVEAQNPQLDQPQPTELAIERPSNNNKMHRTNDHPEWLPHDWIMELKTTKHGKVYKAYVDPSTGHKFYSKPEVLRYIKPVEQEGSTSKLKETPISNVPVRKLIEYKNERPEWLPHGWKLELKTSKSRSARTYKCYVDPSTRRKFFSKPQVLQFLIGVKQKSSKSKRKGKGMQLSMVPTSKVTNESSMEDLPPGWIKKIKRRKSAWTTIRDPYYIDPVNGYVFHSRRDVQRYLDTGDINLCAIKPKKTDIKEKNLPSSATKRQKLESVARHRLIGGDWSSDAGSMAPLRVYSLRNRTKTISAITTVPIPITAEISSYRSPNNDNPELKAPDKADDLDRKEDKNASDNGGRGHLFLESESKQEWNPDSGIKSEERSSLQKSKHLKWLDLPRRCSKRLAGVKPGSLVNSVMPSDDEMAQAVDFNDGILTQSEPGKELLLHNSSDANIPLLGDPSNESQGCDTASPMLTIQASEKSQVEKVSADNVPVLTPEADKKQEKYSLERKKKKRSKVRNENNLRASRKKKEINLPHRSSKRHACIEPEMKPNSASVPDGAVDEPVGVASFLGETSVLISGIGASCPVEGNGGDELSDNPSKARRKKTKFNAEQIEILERNFELDSHPKPERRMELARALGLQPIKIQVWFQNRRSKLKKLLENDRGFLQKEFEAIQAENQNLHAEDERGLESPSPLLGEMSNKNWPFVDARAGFEDNLLTLEFSKSPDKKSDLEFIPALGEIFSDPCLEFAFKTLTGELPIEASIDDPVSTPAACIIGEMGRSIKEKASISSKNSKATKKLSLPHETSDFQPEPVACPTINTAFKHPSRVSSENGTDPIHHPCVNVQGSEKQEQRPFVSFDYWSDPSFDSAFKALAGSIPAKSYFEQQVEPSQNQRDVSSTLPDFGLPSFFQTDVSVHFDSQQKLLFSQPPLPINNQPLFSTCTTITSQPPPPLPLEGMKNQTPPHVKKKRGRPRKVNS